MLCSFTEIMKSVQQMKYSCIVFDTAPTGHTLRLIRFPTTLQTAIDKMMVLKVCACKRDFIEICGCLVREIECLLRCRLEPVWRTDQLNVEHDGCECRDAG